MYKQYTRGESGLRPPRSVSSRFPYFHRATIHYSASELTPIGRREIKGLTKPKQPGKKWYQIWKRPHTTEAERQRRIAVSRVIREYNEALAAYKKALKLYSVVSPEVVALEMRVWRSFQNYHMDVHGWSDIGYHIGIFASGNRYEGRFASAKEIVQGAHAVNANDTIGVTFVTNGPITAHQEASFAEVVKNYDLVGRTFRGHREVPGNSTACPGDIIMEKIVRKYRNG